MQTSSLLSLVLHPVHQQKYPTIDIQPVYIQYMFSFIIILFANLAVLYQLSTQMWRIYQSTDLQTIIHDIYDKTILHTALKYVIVNLICLCYFHDLTSAPVQLMRIFWLYELAIIFMKFDVKQILWPSISLITVLLLFSSLWVWIHAQIPAFKIIFILILIILYYGFSQAWKITKILGSSGKQNKRKQQISVQTLLQKNQTRQQFQSLPFTQLDQHVIPHLQNRRSFCLVLSTVLFIDIILLMDLDAGKELLGEVFLSIMLDLLPLYIVYWYLRKTSKERQAIYERQSRQQSQFNQLSNRKTSKILIEMVNLKN